MSDAKPPQDPSMEEIIASISRVIAAEGGGREPVLPAAPAQDDVLELTEALDRDGGVRRIEPRAGPAGSAAPTPEDATPAPVARIEPEAARADSGAAAGRASEPSRDRILSEKASRAATAAFSRLGERPSGRAAAGELLVGGAGLTLEDIVREALRPLLQSWLDEHLPDIVERLVREEIARVAGAAGTR
jgi:cell pole-organizing protein PopZ